MVFNSNLLTPISLWDDFDDGLPLKEVTVTKIKVDAAVLSEVYFSGRAVGSERVRIFGYYSVPDGVEVKGAVLYLSGENEKIGFDSLKEFNSLGFAVLAVDLYGKRDGAMNYTEYPECVSYANLVDAGDRKDRVDDSAKETCWYEWVAVAKYAVKYLKSLGYEKIAVVGDKTGANVGWQTVAFNEDATCFVALFGAGWTANKNEYRYAVTEETLETDESYMKYVAAVEAHAYAPYVKCPVLYLTATNSEFFEFDRCGDTLSRLDKEVPCYYNYSVGYNVHLDLACKRDMTAFLNRYLADGEDLRKNPELNLEGPQENTLFTVVADGDGLCELKIFVSDGVLVSHCRNWREYSPKLGEDGNFVLSLDLRGKETVFAFCVAEYVGGLKFSSKEVFKRYDSVDRSKTDKLIYFDRNGTNGLGFLDEDGANALATGVFAEKGVELVEGANGIFGAYSADGLISYAFANPTFAFGDDSIIKLDVYAPEFCSLELAFYERAENGVRRYTYTRDFKAGAVWQDLLVKVTDFKSDVGFGIKNHDGIFAFSIYSESKFAVNNILVI